LSRLNGQVTTDQIVCFEGRILARSRRRGPSSNRFKNNHFTEMCSGSEAGSYLRLIDSCITQLKAQGPSRTCNESKEEEVMTDQVVRFEGRFLARSRRGGHALRRPLPIERETTGYEPLAPHARIQWAR